MLSFNPFTKDDIKEIEGTYVAIKDNFFIEPVKIVEYLKSKPPYSGWKVVNDIPPGLKNNNGIEFFDERHWLKGPQVEKIFSHLESFTGHKSLEGPIIKSNIFRMVGKEFNNYKDNFWFPHTDPGLTAIVFLNEKDGVTGTNLYDQVQKDPLDGISEHVSPWRSRKCFKLKCTIESKFNRAIIFDAHNILHSMAIFNDDFFEYDRITLAMFLK